MEKAVRVKEETMLKKENRKVRREIICKMKSRRRGQDKVGSDE